jgi:hypothetical protein
LAEVVRRANSNTPARPKNRPAIAVDEHFRALDGHAAQRAVGSFDPIA